VRKKGKLNRDSLRGIFGFWFACSRYTSKPKPIFYPEKYILILKAKKVRKVIDACKRRADLTGKEIFGCPASDLPRRSILDSTSSAFKLLTSPLKPSSVAQLFGFSGCSMRLHPLNGRVYQATK